MIPAQTDTLHAPDRAANTVHTGRVAAWLERATLGGLFLFAVAAPHSIAATQTAWLLALLLWTIRFFVRPRPSVYRTPVDYALLGFFILTFISALCSYDAAVSIGKLRAASLFTIVYVVAQNIRDRRVLRALMFVLIGSCLLNVGYAFGRYAVGRGVRLDALNEQGTLYAAGARAGDTLIEVDGARVNSPEDVARAVRRVRPADDRIIRWPNGTAACSWDEQTACLRGQRAEVMSVFLVPRAAVQTGDTAAAQLGISAWARGHDDRATGFYGHYTTYAEALQLIGSLALGLFVALRRKRSLQGALLAVAVAAFASALVLTVTRASWLGFLLSAFCIALVGASRRALVATVFVALPLVVAGLFVLQQKRHVGFIDPREGSTAWRLTVWREGLGVLASQPRHLLVGVGMDTIKQHWREWGLFDKGRLPRGHMHSTPLQIAFERGVPALLMWCALIFIYGRMLWRLARRDELTDWRERGLVLGALGGLVGFCASGLVHYNLGDSEVVMIFYFIMGLALALNQLKATDKLNDLRGV